MNTSFLSSHLQQVLTSVHYQIQCPRPLIVNSMLTALSTAMQDFLVVEQPIGIQTPTSLFLLAIAESGERKTTTDKIFSQPIREFEYRMSKNDQEQLEKYEQEHMLWKIKHDELKKTFATATRRNFASKAQVEKEYLDIVEQKPQKPLSNKRLYSDSTIESLLFELSQTRFGGLLISTEAGNLLSKVNANYTSNLNSLWDGESIHIGRKSSGNFSLEQKPLTCALMLQPKVLESILNKKETITRGSGFWARFLICKPDSTQGTRFFQPHTKNFHLDDFHERITELLQISSHFKAMGKVEILTFSEEAAARWIEYSNQIESTIGRAGDLSDIKDYASKVLNNASRIAALLHYYEYGYQYNRPSSSQKISLNSLNAAIQLMEYFTAQFKLIFGEKTHLQLAYELGKILHDYLVRNYLNKTDTYINKDWLYRNGPKQTRKREQLDAALGILTQNGYLTFVNTSPMTYRVTRKFITENNLAYWGHEPLY